MILIAFVNTLNVTVELLILYRRAWRPIAEAIEGTDRNWLEIIGFGARLALGGPAIGAVIGVGGAFFLGYVINDALIEVSLTIILAYSTFALCEATAVKASLSLKYYSMCFRSWCCTV